MKQTIEVWKDDANLDKQILKALVNFKENDDGVFNCPQELNSGDWEKVVDHVIHSFELHIQSTECCMKGHIRYEKKHENEYWRDEIEEQEYIEEGFRLFGEYFEDFIIGIERHK